MAALDLFFSEEDRHRVALLEQALDDEGVATRRRESQFDAESDPVLGVLSSHLEGWMVEQAKRCKRKLIWIRLDDTPPPVPSRLTLSLQQWPALSADKALEQLVDYLDARGKSSSDGPRPALVIAVVLVGIAVLFGLLSLAPDVSEDAVSNTEIVSAPELSMERPPQGSEGLVNQASGGADPAIEPPVSEVAIQPIVPESSPAPDVLAGPGNSARNEQGTSSPSSNEEALNTESSSGVHEMPNLEPAVQTSEQPLETGIVVTNAESIAPMKEEVAVKVPYADFNECWATAREDSSAAREVLLSLSGEERLVCRLVLGDTLALPELSDPYLRICLASEEDLLMVARAALPVRQPGEPRAAAPACAIERLNSLDNGDLLTRWHVD